MDLQLSFLLLQMKNFDSPVGRQTFPIGEYERERNKIKCSPVTLSCWH